MPKIVVKNPEKLYFPGSKITKLQVVEYYQKMAPLMAKYCKDRPVSMERYPGASNNKALFYQKNIPAYFPAWIKRVKIQNKSISAKQKYTTYVLCQNAQSLIYLANQGCVTPHLWLSTVKNLNYPNLLIFDLDPGIKRTKKSTAGEHGELNAITGADKASTRKSSLLMVDFATVKQAALALKTILEAHGLTPFVMTTGSRGLHVRVPIKPAVEFDQVREFARKIAAEVVAQYPKTMTLEARKSKRLNRLLIDVMRNSYGATAVAPYAIRARAGAPVAVPLSWSELKSRGLNAQQYNILNLGARLKRVGDLWAGMSKQAKSLKKLINHSPRT